MILASLRIIGRCLETMQLNGSMNGGIYLGFCFIRFPYLLHMMSQYTQLSSSIPQRLFGSMEKPEMDGLERHSQLRKRSTWNGHVTKWSDHGTTPVEC